jgi:hypothetical protein
VLPWRLPDADGTLVEVQVASPLRFDDLEVSPMLSRKGWGLAGYLIG